MTVSAAYQEGVCDGRAEGWKWGMERAAIMLEEQADRDIEASKLCRSGNSGQTLARLAQRRRSDAATIRGALS